MKSPLNLIGAISLTVLVSFGQIASAQPANSLDDENQQRANAESKLRRPFLIEVKKGSPLDADGSPNWEVVLTSPTILINASIDEESSRRITDLIKQHQDRVKNAQGGISKSLPEATQKLEEWIAVQDSKEQFEQQVTKEFPPEFLADLLTIFLINHLETNSISDFVLAKGVARQLKLSTDQSVLLKKRHEELSFDLGKMIESKVIAEVRQLFSKLSETQKKSAREMVDLDVFEERLRAAEYPLSRLMRLRVYKKGSTIGATRRSSNPESLLLFLSPMNYLALATTRERLDISHKQLAELEKEYSAIKSNGDREIAKRKKEMERQIVQVLNSKQRRTLKRIMQQ